MSIPISQIVSINPGVIGGGGSPLSMNGVILSTNALLPAAKVASFASADSVRSYFGSASDEYEVSQVYFLGFDNSTIKPGTLFFAPYVDVARGAWLRSGSFSGVTLTALQALSGVLTVTVDGVVKTSASISLAAATSFSNAATLITAGFSGPSAPVVTWQPINSTFVLSSPTTGASSTVTFATGTLSAALKLTSATGAVLSQGADVDTPSTAMDSVKNQTTNWATFSTMFEPVIADKTLFAEWCNAQNQRYLYVCWDTDGQAVVQGSTTCFGALAKVAAWDAVLCVSGSQAQVEARGKVFADTVRDLAVFEMGACASIDFPRPNGRTTFAFRSQSGLTPTVDSLQTAENLLANGYSYYGSYSTANDSFVFLYDGVISGKWKYADIYVNQIYLNNQLQLALIKALLQNKAFAYNQIGYGRIRSVMATPIQAALSFGSIQTGITLSESQKATVNQDAGLDVSGTIQALGYYLQILDPGAQVRSNRGSPIVNFWYTDGGSIQKINVSSVDIL